MKHAIYQVLKVLTHASAFEFDAQSSLPLTHFMPTGCRHATCQYMLDTVHIEEVSYEGNIKVIAEWLHQHGQSPEVSCARTIHHMGWRPAHCLSNTGNQDVLKP
jgi:hypothetical protein